MPDDSSSGRSHLTWLADTEVEFGRRLLLNFVSVSPEQLAKFGSPHPVALGDEKETLLSEPLNAGCRSVKVVHQDTSKRQDEQRKEKKRSQRLG